MQQEIIKIHVLGMDERSRNTLSFFFQKFCNGQCEMTEEEMLAKVFLINMDYVDAASDLDKLKQSYPHYPLILTSIKAIDAGENYFLRKPLIAAHLITILDEIKGATSARPEKKEIEKIKPSETAEKQIQKTTKNDTKSNNISSTLTDKEMIAFVGEAQDRNLRQAQIEKDIFFDLQQYFVGFMRQAYLQAKQQQCAVRITGLWKPITVFPESNKIYIEMSDRQLKSICVVTLNSSAIDEAGIKLESLDPEKATHQCEQYNNYQSLDMFMWKIALWTSRGRLPQEIPLDSAVYLLGWPNMTRLILTPEALRICAYWVPHPRTVINLTELLAIPQRYVFSLITATYVLGMSGLANRQSDILILPSDIESTTKINLFARIMKRLRKREL